ncbi:MAG: hypothetical protein COV78_00155 [Candidatus Pacebacteria bacterium CG11_big_fil_rev_8_21_14_0_20_34_55]|nr:MAG: hypothetical protein COV78_00155 [Candidatus Pacebacteria bacterium CG11_big_fil_rev_8_21_14_0_20_34_55]
MKKTIDSLSSFQKIVLVLIIFISAILIMYWRKDVEFERCYSLGQTVRDSDMANFMNTSCGKLLKNKFVN